MNSRLLSPKDFFGFEPGSDYHMIRWDRLCAYYEHLNQCSDRIFVEEVGKSSEGNPFLMIYVSAPENLSQLEKYRKISLKMADPRGLTDAEIDALAAKGRAVCMQSYSLHSNEVGGAQMVPTMLYRFASATDGVLCDILDNVIFIVSPCSEPDGEIIFTDWYEKYLGTAFEGCCSPYLRHNWAGHSNSSDAIRECVVETKYINDVLIRNWKPQVFQDHHHQYPYENRMSIAPIADPIYEPMSAIVLREQALYGAVMAQAMTTAGRRGIVSGEKRYTLSPILTFYNNALLHNTVGMLTESADVHIATPVYIHRDQVQGCRKPCAQCPDAWEGGEWHLSDIVEQMYLASIAILEYMAQNRRAVLKRMAQKAQEQIQRGCESMEKAYLIPQAQHDPSALDLFLKLLKRQCIDFYATKMDLTVGGTHYPAGTIVVPLAQPNYAAVKLMLSKDPYPVGDYNINPDGSVQIWHGDKANLCTALCMGITAYPAMDNVASEYLVEYRFFECPNAFPLSAKQNISYRTANRLLADGSRIFRDREGDFWNAPGEGKHEIFRARVGLLKKSNTGNAEEGFARNLLRRFAFDYRIVMDSEMRTTGVPGDIDVLIIPGDLPEWLVSGDAIPDGKPPEYQSGLGTVGAETLRRFVADGGRLVAWEQSCMYVNDVFTLEMEDLSRGRSAAEYMTAGSLLQAVTVEDDPLIRGMPNPFSVTHYNAPIPCPTDHSGKIKVIARLDRKERVYINGCVKGESFFADTPCILKAQYGKGEILLYTFVPSYHLQQDSTFKLLFNALFREDNL